MNTRGRRSLQSMKAPEKPEKSSSEKKMTNRRGSIRERKIALQQDVDKLKKKLRYEENVHRALERAFTRPLGALPRLPPYLPPNTLELLAEVAVLEEEVVRLEERVVHFRQGLYQEAVYISSSKKNMDSSAESSDSSVAKELKTYESKSMIQTQLNSAAAIRKNFPSLSDECRGKENQLSINSSKTKQQFSNSKVETIKTPIKRHPDESEPASRHLDPQRLQLESQVKVEHQNSKRNHASLDASSNKISESILKCLMGIFLRMTSHKSRSTTDNLHSAVVFEIPADTLFKDPYSIRSKFGNRDIGPYKDLHSIDASSIKPSQTKISVFLIQRLKLLLEKLASVELKGLSHQERLAFWINIYNSCMMNAFIEYGIPDSPEMVAELMQKATMNVSGHVLNAITIEHFILRLPYHSKYTFSKGAKHDDTATLSMFGLELSEPFVTFALSCGSWSSPAVRVYTASQVENELETAKIEYLQAAVGISTAEKYIAIPKLLDWYLPDFAKDIESLLDWICLQLPCELRKDAMECIEMRKEGPFLQSVRIMPYEFSFRYLLHT